MNATAVTLESLRRFKKVTVMGLGLFGGGAGAARFFGELGARVLVTDMASPGKLAPAVESLADLDIEFVLGEHRREDFESADLVVTNQAVRPDHPLLAAARAAGRPVTTETGLALALNRSPWLGITGSAGKSTTVALAHRMLAAADPRALLGGNIGGNLLTRVVDRPADAPLAVELSSFQLTYLRDDFAAGRIRPPAAAVVTNLLKNHLDWHVDFAEYVTAKRALAECQTAGGWLVLNSDDPRLVEWAAASPGRVILCSPDDGGGENRCHIAGDAFVLRLGGEEAGRWPMETFPLPGAHNRANALLAIAAAFAMTRNSRAVGDGLAAFPGLPHRMETVCRIAGRTFVNDSKSTTPEAAGLALEAFAGGKALIAGGYDKKSPFEQLAVAIQQKACALVLVGAAAGRLKQAVLAAAAHRPADMGVLPIADAGDDFDKAVREAYRLCPEGGVVLLSPACASWGMFVNYEERGQRFRDIAAALAGGREPC